MFRVSPQPRRAARKGLLSNVALAIALAAGSVAGFGAIATPAYAQDYSKEWRNQAAPIQEEINKLDNDAEVQALAAQVAAADDTAKPGLMAQFDAKLGGIFEKLAALLPSATTPDDKYTTGQFHLNLGNKLKDPKLQRDGLKLMIDSGKAPEEQKALFNFYVGSLSWELKDLDIARQYLKQAFDLGYSGDNIDRLIAETYFERGQYDQGLAEIDRMVAARGAMIPRDTFLRALEVVRDEKMTDQIAIRGANLLRYHSSPEDWNVALRVVLESFDLTSDESLDLFRLMKATNSLREARAYVDYIEAADARRMANEVLPLIDEATSKGLLDPNDVFVKEARDIASSRAAEDKAAADDDAADALASADSVSARSAADNYISFGDYANAEKFYILALERGPEDPSRIQMRIGVAQAMQGKFDEAKAHLEAVTGKRANVAKMWIAYCDVESAA